MTTGKPAFLYTMAFLLLLPLCIFATGPGNDYEAIRPLLVEHININYSNQLTDPHKKKRRSFSQFGYNLSFFRWELFQIVEFTDIDHLGIHSYGQPGRGENNGVIYTCKGGFIDISHIRAAVDWTVYLTFKIINDNDNFSLPDESGTLELNLRKLEELSLEDIASMSQKIAFERLLWHEIVSWHYHGPNRPNSEQQSAFTPEDTYSNLLGTQIGKNIALRILNQPEDLTYEEIVTEEIRKALVELQPLSIDACMQAYDIVDRYLQVQLPTEERNNDVWWDSNIVFRDQRYVFKRYMHTGPVLEPWLVPRAEQLGCSCNVLAGGVLAQPSFVSALNVPQTTDAGMSLYKYYDFKITPDEILFYNKLTGEQLHPPFEAFSTYKIDEVVAFVGKEMEAALMHGYDKRDNYDPVPSFGKVKRVEHSNGFPFFPKPTGSYH